MKRELERAIRAAGGTAAALARRLRVHPSSVRRWLRDGVPKTGSARILLSTYRDVRKDQRELARRDRQQFALMLKLAGEAKALPHSRSSSGPRTGPRTQGYQYTRAYNQYLTLTLIDDIEGWAQSLPRRQPVWQAAVLVSLYGKGEHRGYKTVYQQFLTIDPGDFALESTLATPRSTSRVRTIGTLRDQLESSLLDASVRTYVHSVTVFNYRLRSEVERRRWESAQRRRRSKKQ